MTQIETNDAAGTTPAPVAATPAPVKAPKAPKAPKPAPVVNEASVAAEAKRGPKLRANALVQGNAYIMRQSTKPTPTFSEVVFIGFGKARDALTATIPSLKLLTDSDLFWIRQADGTEVELHAAKDGAGAVLFANNDRATFANLIGATPAAPPAATEAMQAEATIEAPAETTVVEATQAPEAVIEVPVEAPVEATDEHAGESAKQRARRLAKEAAAKQAE